MALRTILEKAAVDNGFSLDQGALDDWLVWKAHAAPARLCLTATEAGYGIGSDHVGAMRNLKPELVELASAPAGFRAVQVGNSGMLNTAAGAIWRLARSLPDEPLRRYRRRLREPIGATDVERLRKERIGQDVFREDTPNLAGRYEGPRVRVPEAMVPDLRRRGVNRQPALLYACLSSG